MKKTQQIKSPQLRQAVIAHIIPDWAAVAGTCPKALCGRTMELPTGRPVVDAVSTQPNVIVCPLCEAAQMLDGLPDPPIDGYVQQKLF